MLLQPLEVQKQSQKVWSPFEATRHSADLGLTTVLGVTTAVEPCMLCLLYTSPSPRDTERS
eukprot:7512657-Karenia_brevis.AAC.1